MKWMGILLAASVSVTATSSWADACLDNIKQKGALLAGNGLMGTKPFVWKNEDGTYGGFEWEIFQELGKRIGVAKVDYEITEWSTLIPGLKADRWDIILSSMSATQERVQNAGIEFSTPYFLLIDHVIVKGDSPIQSVADLKGRKIGYSVASFQDAYLDAILKSAGLTRKDITEVNVNFNLVTALLSGQVDAAIDGYRNFELIQPVLEYPADIIISIIRILQPCIPEIRIHS